MCDKIKLFYLLNVLVIYFKFNCNFFNIYKINEGSILLYMILKKLLIIKLDIILKNENKYFYVYISKM